VLPGTPAAPASTPTVTVPDKLPPAGLRGALSQASPGVPATALLILGMAAITAGALWINRRPI
jgi:hypothetical protein